MVANGTFVGCIGAVTVGMVVKATMVFFRDREQKRKRTRLKSWILVVVMRASVNNIRFFNCCLPKVRDIFNAFVLSFLIDERLEQHNRT
ncbi:hypothetical protein QVD17_17598 [Tagetes erecta]|uniref:Transmembrane protein n=1 Tax=Tagetes erecta TaxID=13708 RepID=A0AAD8KTI8_TARER|nr:hypothetical protein QVD17_17598 [Tagetes erecta]